MPWIHGVFRELFPGRFGKNSRYMSLRLTLFLGIVLLVTTSLVCGGVLLYWHAVNKVDTEMNAALTVAEAWAVIT